MGHGTQMAAALVAGVITGWAAAILAWALGAPLWLGLLLLPVAGCPVLVLGAALAVWRPARRRGRASTLRPAPARA